ncbi:micro-fibrillar-associated 1 [Atractiella rhizophila]|nr:micro-fibrillar-associated 1 [Atractiella rhizophila]
MRIKKEAEELLSRVKEEEEEEEESESEESSSEESSEEEPAPKPLYKPAFISKRDRNTAPTTLSYEEEETRRAAEEAERKASAHKLVEETLSRTLADKEKEDIFPFLDDTDGLDPEAEFEEWKLRELKRLARDKEERYAREKEREEVEARRALPEAVRLKEDLEHARKTREEKQKGKQVFLQKYHHKGAFYADDEIMKKHDYSAPTEGTIKDATALPKVLQVRDFGKMSRTKWTHLVAEDTTDRQAGWAAEKGGRKGEGAYYGIQSNQQQQGCYNCGYLDHARKDCPFPPKGQDEREAEASQRWKGKGMGWWKGEG